MKAVTVAWLIITFVLVCSSRNLAYKMSKSSQSRIPTGGAAMVAAEEANLKAETAANLRAIGEAQHAAKCAAARASFHTPNPVFASRWDSSSGGGWKEDPNIKLVHFIRHGQGYHNLLGEVARNYGAEFSETGDYELAVKEQCPYMLPAILDPPLTAVGREDAKKLRTLSSAIHPQLYVVSPMKRATQTILIGFSEQLKASTVPLLAHEGCREQCGVFLCDKRSSLSEYREEFPTVDYSLMNGSEEDALWQMKQRETMLEMSHRANAFIDWLFERDEKEIVVGTHSAWLMALFNVVLELQQSGERSEGDLKSMFATGEMRSILLTRKPRISAASATIATTTSVDIETVTDNATAVDEDDTGVPSSKRARPSH